MRFSRENRLKQIEDILWNTNSSLTVKQITKILKLNSQSYVSSLLKELESIGKVNYQLSMFDRRIKEYQPSVSNFGQLPTDLPFDTPLYKPLDEWAFDNDHCFLCGIFLVSDNRSKEHVFPKWLQRRYKLFNMELDLLNGTPIPYKSLTIPCCKNCNGVYLGNLESKVQQAHDVGFESFSKLPPMVIFQWVAKIFYGILFRELSLRVDRKNPANGYIFEPDRIKSYGMIHQFLQSVRIPFTFIDFHPWSIFIVRVMDLENKNHFMWQDNILQSFFSIRMGEIGIVACLEDGGLQSQFLHEYLKDITQLSLHPIQFAELCAVVNYNCSRLNRDIHYFTQIPTNLNDGLKVFMSPIAGLSSRPILDDYDAELYSEYLLHYMRHFPVSPEHIRENVPRGLTWIYNEESKLCQLDKNGKIVNLIEPNRVNYENARN